MRLLKLSKNKMFYMDTVDVHYYLHTLLTPYLFAVMSRSNACVSLALLLTQAVTCPSFLCKIYSTSAVSI